MIPRAALTLLVLLATARGQESPAIAVGETVEIIGEDVGAKVGLEDVAVVEVGDRFEALGLEAGWVRIKAAGKEGWVPRTKVRPIPDIEMGDIVEVTATTTPVKVGKADVANVAKGRRLVALECRPPWFRVRTDGRVGWVAKDAIRRYQPSYVESEAEVIRRFEAWTRAIKVNDRPGALEQGKCVLRLGLRNLQLWLQDPDRLVRAQELEFRRGVLNPAQWLAGAIEGDEVESVHAVELRRVILAMRKRIDGRDHPNTVSARVELDRALVRQGLSVSDRKRVLAADAEAIRVRSLSGDAAITALRGVLVVYDEVVGRENPDYGAGQYNLGQSLAARGAFTDAKAAYEEAIRIYRGLYGDDHPHTAESMYGLARLHRDAGQYDTGLPIAERVVAICRKAIPKEAPFYTLALNELAVLHFRRLDYAAAQQLFEEIVAIRLRSLGTEHPLYATALDNLALLHHERGDVEAARPLFEQALSVHRATRGEKSRDYAYTLNNHARLLRAEGDRSAARAGFERAAEIFAATAGREHEGYLGARTNLAEVLGEIGEFDVARRVLEEVVEIRGRIQGAKHPDVATSLTALAHVLRFSRRRDDAKPLLQRALAIRREVLGEDHPQTTVSLLALGNLEFELGNESVALDLQRRVIATRRRTLGDRHPAYAQSLLGHASQLKTLGDYDAAEPMFEEALAILLRVRGDAHPDTATCQINLAQIHALRGEDTKAVARFEEERRTGRRYIARVLPGLSESERVTFLDRSEETAAWHVALSYGFLHRSDPTVAERSAAWALNGKSLAVESLAKSLRAARSLDAPGAAELVEQLRIARTLLARESLRDADPERPEHRRTAIDDLQREVDDVVARLGRLGLEAAGPDEWTELADVRRAIPMDAAFVEIARLPVRRFQAGENRWNAPRYVAWIIRRTGPVRVVDLGEAAAIESDVTEVREHLASAPKRIRADGEDRAEAADRQRLRRLAGRVLDPVLAELDDDVRQVVLGPDGELWLVPWAALPLQDGRYAVERYEFAYVVSGRDFVVEREPAEATHEPLVLADPDFDLAPRRTRSEPSTLRGDSVIGEIPEAGRLPATAAEARVIAPGIRALTGNTPNLFLGAEATETVLKRTPRPMVLSLATHGYFLPGSDDPDDVDASIDQPYGSRPPVAAKAIDNPLLRCGLLLAGANQRSLAAADVDDGVLTGAEIVATDLRGTRLVVLSACETGIGRVRNGEGVAGLRQAFQLAGAEAVVASLWQVDDLATARLMRDLFDELSKPDTPASAALRRTQLARLESRRDRYGAAHPFYWAAFTSTGR